MKAKGIDSDYIQMAIQAGYTGTDEKLTEIGMAIELAEVAWSWYESGNDRDNVAAIFQYSESEPNVEETIGAYAEGAANQ